MAKADGMALSGVNVLDFTWWGAGPFGTKYLADLGATVLKIESSRRLDWTRVSGPFRREGNKGIDASGLFLHANTSKLSMTLDLTHPKGMQIVKRLVRWADVVVENFSAGTMERMGLGYQELKKVRADIIMVSSSSFGQTGVFLNRRGAAHIGGAMGGHFLLTGWPDRDPGCPASIGWADITQPLLSATSILAALHHRRRTGEGQYIDIAQIEVMSHLLAPSLLDYQASEREAPRSGNRHPDACPHGAFRCQGEDAWCAIACFSDWEWQRLCQAMGEPDWCRDGRFSTLPGRKASEDELERLIETWTVQHSPQEVMALCQQQGVRAGAVQNAADLMDGDPHVKARELFLEIEHPVLGKASHPSTPARFSRTPARTRTAPMMGEHTDYVCTHLLGMSPEECAALRKEGVLA